MTLFSKTRLPGFMFGLWATAFFAMSSEARPVSPRWNCSAKHIPGALVLTYTFHNRTKQSLRIFDRLYRADASGTLSIDDTQAYVFSGSDGVTVAKQLFEVPARLKPDFVHVPGVTEVAPGQRVTGTMQVPWPLEMAHPYVGGTKAPTLGTPDRLTCALGYLPVDATHYVRDFAVGGQTLRVPDYHAALKDQRWLTHVVTVPKE